MDSKEIGITIKQLEQGGNKDDAKFLHRKEWKQEITSDFWVGCDTNYAVKSKGVMDEF